MPKALLYCTDSFFGRFFSFPSQNDGLLGFYPAAVDFSLTKIKHVTAFSYRSSSTVADSQYCCWYTTPQRGFMRYFIILIIFLYQIWWWYAIVFIKKKNKRMKLIQPSFQCLCNRWNNQCEWFCFITASISVICS
jgi:hypothetical protein